jgi:hypothetical protein
MRKPAFAAFLLLAALSLAGCGSDRAAVKTYRTQLNTVQAQGRTDAETITRKLAASKTPQAIAARLAELSAALGRNADRTAAIKPPDDVAGEHQRYVAATRKFSTQLRALAAKIKPSSPPEANALIKSNLTPQAAAFQKDSTRLLQLIQTKLSS